MRGGGRGRGNDELQPPAILLEPLERETQSSRPTSGLPAPCPTPGSARNAPPPQRLPFFSQVRLSALLLSEVSAEPCSLHNVPAIRLRQCSRSWHHRGRTLYLTGLGHPGAGLRDL